MPYTHVIFDLDGTILNTLEDLADAANQVCRAHGWPTFPVDSYRYKVGNGMAKLVERFMPAEYLGDQPMFDRTFAEFRTYYDAHKEDHTAPYPGVLDMLDRLRAAGLTLIVLTNKDHDAAEPLVRHFFGDRFALVQGHTEAFPPKPAAPITRHAMAAAAAPTQSTLYVGDSNVDVQTGHNAELPVIGAAWGFRGREELECAGADFIAEAPQDVVDIACAR